MKSLAEYPWSGHSVLMGTRNVGFQDTRTVLRRFGADSADARRGYEEFIRQGTVSDEDAATISTIRESNKGTENVYNPGCWVIGDPEFVKKALQRDEKQRIRAARYAKEGWTLPRLFDRICRQLALQPEKVLAGGKNRVCSDGRKIFCHIARQYFEFPTSAIADFLSVSPAAVSISAGKGREIFKDNRKNIDI